MIALFSTTPTAKPARSYSPAAYMPGILGGLAADQRAAGVLAAVRDALDDVGGDVDVELAAGEVVEEEQRLGALHEDVVDAHRDEIDADRVVAVERERELRAWCRRRRCRRRAPARESACRSRPARRSRRCRRAPRAHRPLREGLDALDERVAGVDVDAGVAIGKGCGRRTDGHNEVKCSVFERARSAIATWRGRLRRTARRHGTVQRAAILPEMTDPRPLPLPTSHAALDRDRRAPPAASPPRAAHAARRPLDAAPLPVDRRRGARHRPRRCTGSARC